MAKYRNKPVVIDAFRVWDLLNTAARDRRSLPKCISDEYEAGNVLFLVNAIWIKTLDGRVAAEINDWIIRDMKGELSPCKPDIFEATYEAVE